MAESKYQAKLIKKLHRRFPGCVVMKNDSGYIQGIPDLTVLYGECWAALEVKESADATLQPNQNYYIQKLDEMSFAAIVYPENERYVLNALQEAFETGG